jgi:hypothetical protein
MIKIRNKSGFYETRLTEEEQNKLWKIINTPIPRYNVDYFTPQDNYKYQIVSEENISYGNFIVTIYANGKKVKIKCNIANEDVKINKAVRKAYNVF